MSGRSKRQNNRAKKQPTFISFFLIYFITALALEIVVSSLPIALEQFAPHSSAIQFLIQYSLPLEFLMLIIAIPIAALLYRSRHAENAAAFGAFIIFFIAVSILLEGLVAVGYQAGLISAASSEFAEYAASSMSFSISVVLYLVAYKGMRKKEILSGLGFNGKGMARKVKIGILIFLIILCLEFIVGLLGQLANVQINTGVETVFSGAPLWFYIFIAVIAPINEETLFRGFMVPRIGIVASALIFGVAHYTYMSTFGVEMFSAFVFGLIAGYVFKRTKSIYPSLIAHSLVNILGVVATFG